MILDWFFKDKFEQFYSKVERLQKFLRIADTALSIEHFEELRKHFNEIKLILPKLSKLYSAELGTISTIPPSPYKIKLEKFADDLNIELNDLGRRIDNALLLIEEILKIRILTRCQDQKEKLKKIIYCLTSILIKAQRDSFQLVKLEKTWKKSIVGTTYKKPVTKIAITGSLNDNGWRLSDIQSVIIDLGGRVEKNPGGTHPYKIIFPERRPIPLAESTLSFRLVKEINSETGIEPRILIASFSKGMLVAA